MSSTNKRLLFFVVLLAAVFPVILLRDFTPSNELRYLSIADEALENGTLFAFTNHGEPYADKPPLYFWGVMAGKWLAGSHQMWLLSLLALLPAFGIMWILDRWTAPETSRRTRVIALIVLATSAFFIGSAITLRMDMLMCLFIVLALWSFWRMFMQEGRWRREQWLFPVWLFLAVFTKGPLGFLIPFVSTLVFLLYARQFRTIGRYWGWRTWTVLLCLLALWFLCVYLEGGKEYLDNLLFHQTVDRAVNSFHHKRPFFYYGIAIWYCIAPWSIMIVGILIAKLNRKTTRSQLHSFFLVVGLSTFVLLSCISSKLQIYMLPAIPFLAYGAVMFLPEAGNAMMLRLTLSVPASLLALALPGVLVVNHLQPELVPPSGWIIAAAAVLTATGVTALWLLFGKQTERTALNVTGCIGGGLLLAVFLGGWSLPQFNPSIGYKAVGEAALKLGTLHNVGDYHTWQLSRPENIDVYLGTDVVIIDDDMLPEAADTPYVLLTKKKNSALFQGYEQITAGPYMAVYIPSTQQSHITNE